MSRSAPPPDHDTATLALDTDHGKRKVSHNAPPALRPSSFPPRYPVYEVKSEHPQLHPTPLPVSPETHPHGLHSNSSRIPAMITVDASLLPPTVSAPALESSPSNCLPIRVQHRDSPAYSHAMSTGYIAPSVPDPPPSLVYPGYTSMTSGHAIQTQPFDDAALDRLEGVEKALKGLEEVIRCQPKAGEQQLFRAIDPPTSAKDTPEDLSFSSHDSPPTRPCSRSASERRFASSSAVPPDPFSAMAHDKAGLWAIVYNDNDDFQQYVDAYKREGRFIGIIPPGQLDTMVQQFMTKISNSRSKAGHAQRKRKRPSTVDEACWMEPLATDIKDALVLFVFAHGKLPAQTWDLSLPGQGRGCQLESQAYFSLGKSILDESQLHEELDKVRATALIGLYFGRQGDIANSSRYLHAASRIIEECFERQRVLFQSYLHIANPLQ
ncbi:hypothetical protein F5Y16DRAFT_401016 [Xylariaceae sp. FL0255]|nr:hypothetical protein F5Y16DRAFT_401016 [Xylariaceae sp. FL0255]